MIKQYEPYFGKEEADALTEYMKSGGWITEFKKTADFENKIKDFLKVKYCSVVNNGTISLTLALLAVGVKAGNEVIVPNLTMIATPNAVRLMGAKPIFVDVCKENLCMDLEQAITKFNKKTKAVIYVSLNGRSHEAELDVFKKKCADYKIAFIEDSAQSFASKNYDGSFCGTTADIGSFSFSIPKIISTGQGGCLVTNNEAYGEKIRKLKDFGRESGGIDIHDEFGINCKFTDLQAVVGIVQISYLQSRINKKKEIYRSYQDKLKSVKAIEFIDTDLNYVTPWFIDIYTSNKQELKESLSLKGIGTRDVYPPISKQKVYNLKDSFPITERYSSRGLWLPSSFSLTEKDIEYICCSIKEIYNVKD